MGYNKATGAQMNYAAIGSGGGIKQIDAKTVNFGATDDPRTEAELKEHDQFQFPTAMGGVVPVINVAGVAKLTLDGAILADIFSGKITKWNDAAIAKLNPGVTLPDTVIVRVVRADASGTTAVFTDYLAQVSEQFNKDVGHGKTVIWGGASSPAAGKGNAGVAAFIKQFNGAIGYVEYAYVKQGGLQAVALKNKSGKVVEASETAFADAAAGANWAVPGMAVNLNNQAKGWPITAATFVVIYKNDHDRSVQVTKFFDWAFANGDAMAVELSYVPLPEKVKAHIKAGIAKEVK
jgi:phosphate transport system substrate-binding protein